MQKEKIRLRKPKPSDLKEFRNVFDDREMVKQLAGYKYPFTEAEAKKSLKETIRLNKKGDYYEFAIIYKNKFVGMVVLEKPTKDKKTFTLGYAVGRAYWGKGIASEAVKRIINFGFNKLRLKKIVADNDEDNPASARVLEKNGFLFLKKGKRKKGKTRKNINILYWERKR
jgi:RimJ/RimL family protein N-acetyltransferase